ncbi:MAG: CoA transferase subunit A [Planctomycetes bacterium]|nr:CoA transferase subunit A [Planctomycetota bacterium]
MPLFASPNCEEARMTFRARDKRMRDKVTDVADAVRRFVNDGDYLASGGFGGDRIATALLHEIVRQRRQSLSFAGHTATHDFQILCAGNNTGRGQLLARCDIAYVVGLEARGLSPHARRVVESGQVEICEWSNYALAVRFQAAAMGVPFLPLRSMAGTDTFRFSAARSIQCPFTGIPLVAVPALWPDVAVIHVHDCDRFGNCRIRGTSVADWQVARAAKKLIVSCERIISDDEIRADPTATTIPFYCVDAVCEVPFGSYPGNMPYEYYSDEIHLREWLTAEEDPQRYQEFIDRILLSVDCFADYLERSGGKQRMQSLRDEELFPERSGGPSS